MQGESHQRPDVAVGVYGQNGRGNQSEVQRKYQRATRQCQCVEKRQKRRVNLVMSQLMRFTFEGRKQKLLTSVAMTPTSGSRHSCFERLLCHIQSKTRTPTRRASLKMKMVRPPRSRRKARHELLRPGPSESTCTLRELAAGLDGHTACTSSVKSDVAAT